MHDPDVVAFEIPRPWPRRSRHHDAKPGGPRWSMRYSHTCGAHCAGRPAHKAGTAAFPWWRPSSYSKFWCVAGRGLYWPSLITVWHREPGGRDSGEVCKHWTRWQDADGKWHAKRRDRWRWHVHHWRVQVHPLQGLRRWALTRCEWCGGRSRRGDVVNVSRSWDCERSPWWRGERGLFHQDCSIVKLAHRTCTCSSPILDQGSYGCCARCARFRGFGATAEWLVNAARVRDAIPVNARNRAAYDEIFRRADADV